MWKEWSGVDKKEERRNGMMVSRYGWAKGSEKMEEMLGKKVMSKKGNERIEIETSTRENTERMRRTGEQNNNKRERG